MPTNREPAQEPAQLQDGAARPLSRCLSLDLEVGVKDQRIHAFAAIRPDTGQSLAFPNGAESRAAALSRLDHLAQGADFLLGHNILAFDLLHLAAIKPDLQLLNLPAVDTLRLNPLAFPRNPYHHLVKHYQDGQLRRGSRNDPYLDSQLTLDLFADQQDALANTTPDLLTAWHWLTTADGNAGFDRVFAHLRKADRPTDQETSAVINNLLRGNACQTQAQAVADQASRHGWNLAFALAWLSVAGGNSVLPPWVRHQFPLAGTLTRQLRDTGCLRPECAWCRDRHDATKELKRWFGFSSFRPEPADEAGKPLQQTIVEQAMAREHLLAILPTGAGKSICYQAPALSRYDKTGALTVVISPLVALMQDQITGLQAQGISSAFTINSLLSMPERSDALDKVRLGDASILIISPEQLRSVSVRRVLAQREIGAWVLDEAHCLSKWGHDFRTDYRYVGRFIKETAGDGPIPPVLCLTATAKPDVKAEIVEYFGQELQIDLKDLDGGAGRTNLEFVVVQTDTAHKLTDIYGTIAADLPSDEPGGVIIYCATRRQTEEVAGFLQEKGLQTGFFHGAMPPEAKKDVQHRFIAGDLRAIAATNAFGMGIDKPDVRLVIHADIPGSLENYIQEAGRAGRDQQAARCILMYNRDDVERQFGMSARSKLSQQEIQAVLRALRQIDRKTRQQGEVVATTGEILSEEAEHIFQRDTVTDDTRVRTAVSWLEEAVLLAREENRVQIFPSSLRVNSRQQAQARIQKPRIAKAYQEKLLAITDALIQADPDQGISTDQLMEASGLGSEQVQQALHDLEQLGIASNDTALTAFVHTAVQHSSLRRFQQAAGLEVALIQLLQERNPDQASGDRSTLNLTPVTQELKAQGHRHALPLLINRLVHSIAADGRDEGAGRGSLSLRSRDRESIQVTLQREWNDVATIAELRRTAADTLLKHLLSTLPKGARGTDLLAETTLGQLVRAINENLMLRSRVRRPDRLAHRALLWLHEQEVIRLNKGLTVLRPAMTIRLQPGTRRFVQADFQPLGIHYNEQVRQIHVMAEYAEKGLESMADALRLAMDYFSLPQEEFLQRWLPGRDQETRRETTPESWNNIVESLHNPAQRRIVTDDREQTNVLVLAGPGSGKTRALAHRIAYLIRVKRENPRSILALAYNRHAAVQIRRRLADLIGDDAQGVMVLTCHALAMRLVGVSFADRARRPDDTDFQKIVEQAVALLEGSGLPPAAADEQRSRLLAGFRWILVDEYQDIGQTEYRLISALAGRTLPDQDDKLSIFAVGDDDQNIYSFNGSSVRFIKDFQNDYSARTTYLTENYRSTANIINAANAVIAPAGQRMKTDRPIAVNRTRAQEPPGGPWTLTDPVTRGRVQILNLPDRPAAQAQAVIAELQRLSALDPDWNWANCAVIARQWNYLDPVRSLCQLEDIPVQLANEDFSGVWHLRETRALRDWIAERDSNLITAPDINQWLSEQTPGPWIELLQEAADQYALELEDSEMPAQHFIEWLAEWGKEVRRRQRGLLLLTAHRAKGLEFDHVAILDGAWNRLSRNEDADAPRRLYYVAMTRAKETLTLARFPSQHHFQAPLLQLPAVLQRQAPVPAAPPEQLGYSYRQLGLSDVDLSFPGRRPPSDPIHKAISKLSSGDTINVRLNADPWQLTDQNGNTVGRLARSFTPPASMTCISATVAAVINWSRDNSTPEFRDRIRSDTWEVVIPELTLLRVRDSNDHRRGG